MPRRRRERSACAKGFRRRSGSPSKVKQHPGDLAVAGLTHGTQRVPLGEGG
jgi:hypothetical protein